MALTLGLIDLFTTTLSLKEKYVMFVVFSKLSKKDGQKMYSDIKAWFKNHPKRRVCNTDIGKVRKSHMKEDILRFCVEGIKLRG